MNKIYQVNSQVPTKSLVIFSSGEEQISESYETITTNFQTLDQAELCKAYAEDQGCEAQISELDNSGEMRAYSAFKPEAYQGIIQRIQRNQTRANLGTCRLYRRSNRRRYY